VKAQCLPFSQIPHTTRLFADFLDGSPELRPFLARPPRLAEWIKDETVKPRYEATRRDKISSILERQNRNWDASAKTLANVARLRAGASAAVTGQQVGLFGGPVFALYKALSAVKLADESTRAGVETVPVFWLATQDHDLSEIDHVVIPGAEASLQNLVAPTEGVPDAPVGAVKLGPEIDSLVATAASLLGSTPVVELLRDCYRAGELMGNAFARLYAHLFAEWGVILLDASDPELNAVAAPIYSRAIDQASELEDRLLKRGQALEAAGYHQQVKVTESSTLLFALRSGTRVPVHCHSDGSTSTFIVGDEPISASGLRARINVAPHEFSPNVLLRPVVQDYLLPTLVYTGGAAEVAYFAQASAVYETLLERVTPIVPRFSATVVEPRLQGLLERYGVTLTDVFRGPEALREDLARQALPQELQAAFDQADTSLKKSVEPIREALIRLDKTLGDSAANASEKMHYQLEQLRSRAARAELRQAEVLGRHAQLLSNALYPEKTLQERVIPGVYFLSRYGEGWLRDLYECMRTDCLDHQVVTV